MTQYFDEVPEIEDAEIDVATMLAIGPPGRGFNPKGEWQPGTVYDIDDSVTHLGSSYRVTQPHVSPSVFDGTSLQLFAARGEQGEIGRSGGIAVLSTTTVVGGGDGGTPTPGVVASNDIRALGAKCDAQVFLSMFSTTNNSPLIVASQPIFTPADVGKVCLVEGSFGRRLGTIAQYDSPTQVRAAANFTTTASACTMTWGTDDTVALKQMIALKTPWGGDVHVPGLTVVTEKITVPGGVVLNGEGWDYGLKTGGPISRGSAILGLFTGGNTVVTQVQLRVSA